MLTVNINGGGTMEVEDISPNKAIHMYRKPDGCVMYLRPHSNELRYFDTGWCGGWIDLQKINDSLLNAPFAVEEDGNERLAEDWYYYSKGTTKEEVINDLDYIYDYRFGN
jgi:hypothetical protein